jgi:autotransporter passenger strand-loop-strand repeat protein
VQNLTVSSGGVEVLSQGASISGVTVGNGVSLVLGWSPVGPSASASDITVTSGGIFVDEGGVVSGLKLENGATEVLGDLASLSNVTVSTGRTLAVGTLGSVSGVTVQSGGKIEFDGGTVTGLTVKSGGIEAVGSGGTLTLSSGKVLGDVVVSAGGTLVLSGGTASHLTVGSGGIEAVASGVTVKNPTLVGGETLIVSSGGSVTGTVTLGKASDLTIGDASSFDAKVKGFAAGDTLDLAAFPYTSETVQFTENAANTGGTLTVTDGTLRASVTLFGQYLAAGFSAAVDGFPGGTAITYQAPPAAHAELAAGH